MFKNVLRIFETEILEIFKVTVQFETEGNGQNKSFSSVDRSEVKL